MNDTIKIMMNHRSIRNYLKKDVDEKLIETIVKTAQAAPSSINGQQISIISVREPEKKSKLAFLAGEQKYIEEAPVFLVFAMDFYRSELACKKNNLDMIITNDVESIMVGSVDVGIALSSAITAAESLGLGIVPIGGIRKNPNEVIEILELPNYVFPMVGLVVGYEDGDSSLKPRLPIEAVYHKEKYNSNLEYLIDKYDDDMSEYMKKRTNGKSNRNWSTSIAKIYNTIYYPKVKKAVRDKGFKCYSE